MARRQNKSLLPSSRVLLLGLCGIVALLLWLLAHAVMQGLHHKEQARVELYWNGYAKLYAEQNGSFAGLQERLNTDQYVYGKDSGIAAAFYSRDGSLIASMNSGVDAAELRGRLIPVFLGGTVIGYTQAVVESPAHWNWIVAGMPIACAILLYAGGRWHMRRTRLAAEQAQHRAASLLYERMTGKPVYEHPELRESMNAKQEAGSKQTMKAALQAADELLARMNKLETVRRTMVADIAHELRTPIAIMRTQLDHAIQDNLPLPLEKAVALHDETLRLTKLVRDLQELSLAETGHLPLFKSWFSLTALVSEVVETLAIEAEERDISSVVVTDKDLTLYADESRVRQIIINLVGNAFGHARSRVRIELMHVESEATVTVVVSDDGWGMEEEELNRVFDRFYRGDSQLKQEKRSSGLGLGLAIVREYALAHHGSVQVSSRFGEGTSFRLLLPVMTE